jgi:pimeloyl-ACP methyl ester carboxylesterase
MPQPVDLAYRSYGAGEPLIVLHGLFGSARNWHSIAQALGERWRVYTLDLRNHGASGWSDDASYPALAADLEAFLETHAPAGALVVGHSMGGKAAMALALSHPELVRALAVLDMAPVEYRHGGGHLEYIEAMRGMDLQAVRRRADADQALAAVVPEPGIRQFLLQNLVSEEGAFSWRINLEALAAAMPQIMGFPAPLLSRSYQGPTLFLHGGRSEYLLPEHHPLIRRLFPAATIRALPGAGHWLHAEQPDAVRRALEEFLPG